MADDRGRRAIVWESNVVSYDVAAGETRDTQRAQASARWWTAVKAIIWLVIISLVGYAAFFRSVPPAPAASVFDRLQADLATGDRWGEAAVVLADQKNPIAEAYYAMAVLLDPDDARWQQARPRLERSVEALAAASVRDDEWVATLARRADGQRAPAASRALYDFAAKLDPVDQRWPKWRAHEAIVERLARGYNDDETWGELGDSFIAVGDPRAAEECYAVARLIEPGDAEWLRHRPDLGMAAGGVQRFNIAQASWIGDRGRTAEAVGAPDAAIRLYELAAKLDSANRLWPSRAGLVRLRGRVAAQIADDELWGDLGDAQAALGETQQAAGAYGVARLLAPDDIEWQTKATDLLEAAAALRRAGVHDDEFVGPLGDRARDLGHLTAARALYTLAQSLDPADVDWQERLRALDPPRPSAPPLPPEEPVPAPQPPQPAPIEKPPVVVSPPPPPQPATLTVRARFPVVVKIGNDSRGLATTHQVKLAAGSHIVNLEAAHVFYRSAQQIDAIPGASLSLGVPEVVRIQVAAVPANARLYINGWYARILPGPVDITTGRHDFEFRWPALGRIQRQSIEVLQNGQHIIGQLP